MEIGIWGDSIAYGEGDVEALGWVGRFRKSIVTKGDIQVYNFGVCGDTSKDLLKRFALEAESIDSNTIVFAIGINDSKFKVGETTNNVPLDSFKENVTELIKQAKTFTENIYIVSAAKVDGTVRPSGTRFVDEEIQTYNTALKELSEKENCRYIDVFNIIDPATDLFDGLHPNASGYEKLFQTIAPQLT